MPLLVQVAVNRKSIKFHQHETLNEKYKVTVCFVTNCLLFREKMHSDFGILVGFTLSNDPESYAGGTVASQVRQVRGDDPNKRSWSPSLVIWRAAENPTP